VTQKATTEKQKPHPVEELDTMLAEHEWWTREPDPEWNIHRRLLWVQANTPKLAKDLDVATGGGKSYKGISHDLVVAEIRPLLVRAGIAVEMSVEQHSHEWRTVTTQRGEYIAHWHEVACLFTFINIHDPENKIEARGYGTGLDTQDKGYGKATSYAKKYALLTATLAETGEDPERGEQVDDAGPSDPQPQRDKSDGESKMYGKPVQLSLNQSDHRAGMEIPYEAWLSVAERWSDGKKITVPQIKRLYAIAREQGWPDQAVADVTKFKLGIESMKDIPMDAYDQVCSIFASFSPTEGEPGDDDDIAL
jgi:hypothetical protein